MSDVKSTSAPSGENFAKSSIQDAVVPAEIQVGDQHVRDVAAADDGHPDGHDLHAVIPAKTSETTGRRSEKTGCHTSNCGPDGVWPPKGPSAWNTPRPSALNARMSDRSALAINASRACS